MIPLSEIREQLDEIDSQIVRLYEKRMELCTEVGLTKIASGKKVYDKEREMQKLATLSQMASNEFNQRGITELYEQLMAMSRKLQYQILTEHGVIGKTAFIGIDSSIRKVPDLYSRVWKGHTARRRSTAISGRSVTAFMCRRSVTRWKHWRMDLRIMQYFLLKIHLQGL